VTAGVRQLGFSYFDEFWINNSFRANGRGVDFAPMLLVCTETNYTGALGFPQLYKFAYPIFSRYQTLGGTRKALGSAYSPSGRVMIPWSSAVADAYHTRPAGIDSRDGTTFIHLDTPIAETVSVSESLVVTP
jgi:hypothetical protein